MPFSEFVYADVANADVRDPETSGGTKWDGGSAQDGGWDGGGDPDDPAAPATAKCLLNRDYPYSMTNETPDGADRPAAGSRPTPTARAAGPTRPAASRRAT